MFGDDEELTKANMLTFPDFPGIEDVFSKGDFAKIVLGDDRLTFAEANSAYVKKATYSKLVLAFQFFIQVRDGKMLFDQLEAATQEKISAVVEAITSRLKAK